MNFFRPLLATVLFGCTASALADPPKKSPALTRSPAAENAEVFIISPTDGAEVTSPITVKFGIKGMNLVPAGVEQPHSGHHHLLIDINVPDHLDRPIVSDEQHLHFGKGQTEAVIELSPGSHRLQMILGDHFHVPHQPAVVSKPINITVKAPANTTAAVDQSKASARE